MQTIQTQNKKEPVIGLALGGGGSLGISHIGVLKVLEKNGIKISKIAGTSMGAIVGALYSYGYSAKEIYNIAKTFNSIKIIDINLAGKGIFSGKGAERILLKYLSSEVTFNDLKIDFCSNAVNLKTGQEEVLNSGSVLKATKASFSVPLVFKPTEIDGNLYVDGGLLNNVPDNHVKNMGADIVIAVNVINEYPKNAKVKNIIDIMDLSLIAFQVNNCKNKQSCADIIIKPKVSNFKQYKFNKSLIESVIKQGEMATKKALPEILKKIEEFNNNN